MIYGSGSNVFTIGDLSLNKKESAIVGICGFKSGTSITTARIACYVNGSLYTAISSNGGNSLTSAKVPLGSVIKYTAQSPAYTKITGVDTHNDTFKSTSYKYGTGGTRITGSAIAYRNTILTVSGDAVQPNEFTAEFVVNLPYGSGGHSLYSSEIRPWELKNFTGDSSIVKYQDRPYSHGRYNDYPPGTSYSGYTQVRTLDSGKVYKDVSGYLNIDCTLCRKSAISSQKFAQFSVSVLPNNGKYTSFAFQNLTDSSTSENITATASASSMTLSGTVSSVYYSYGAKYSANQTTGVSDSYCTWAGTYFKSSVGSSYIPTSLRITGIAP